MQGSESQHAKSHAAEISLSVVIPFYNEEETIGPLASEVATALDAAGLSSWEMLLVDDGSTDKTGELADGFAREDRRIRALHLAPNSGQSAALAAGFRAARGTYIATLDGDGQNDPSDIPRALEELQARGVEMIAGIRARRRDSAVRRLSSRVAFRVRNAILDDGAIDTGCGLKVFTRADMIRMPLFRNSHRYYPALYQMHGLRVAQIPVNHRPRTKGASKYGGGINSRLWKGLFDLVGVYWLKKRAFRHRVAEHEERE